MTQQSSQVWYFILGGGFLGFWLYLAFLPDSPHGWVLWGVLGIAIAAAFYAGRLANEQVRIGIWIFTGIFLGFLTAAAFAEESTAIIATFVTGAGAGLIAAGLPPHHERADADPTPSPARRPEEPYPGHTIPPGTPDPPRNDPAAPQQWQRAGSQQQGVTIYGSQYR